MQHNRHAIGQYSPALQVEAASEAPTPLDVARTQALAIWESAHALIVGNDGTPMYDPNCLPGHMTHTDGQMLTITPIGNEQKPRSQRTQTLISHDIDGNLVVGIRGYRKSREEEGDYTMNRVTNEYTLTPDGKAQCIEEEGMIREGAYRGAPETFVPRNNGEGGTKDAFRTLPMPSLTQNGFKQVSNHLRMIQEGPPPKKRPLATVGQYLSGLVTRQIQRPKKA